MKPRKFSGWERARIPVLGAAVLIWALARAASAGSCVAVPAGAVAWWRAESNTLDSISINDMTFGGGPGFGRPFTPGKVGLAFYTWYSFLTNSISEELDVGAGAGFTVEGWIYPRAVTQMNPILGWLDSRGMPGVALVLNNPSGSEPGLEAYLSETNSQTASVTVLRGAHPGITNNVWQHVALTFDKASGVAALFHNGTTLVQTNLGLFRPQTRLPVTLGLAGIEIGSSQFFGALDEFTIYNRALSVAEIQAIVAADSAGKCPPPLECAPPPSDFVAWWRGESNALDHVDGNHGVITQSVIFPNGRVGNCFYFNQGYIRVPASSNLNVGVGSGLTVEAWMKPESFYHVYQPLVEWNSGTGTQGVSFVQGPSGSLQADLVDTFGLEHRIFVPQRILTLSNWNHVALTYDKGSGRAALYLNGFSVAQTNLGSFTPRTSHPLYFGYSPPTPYIEHKFRGALDEISLYARALGADEIKAIVKARGLGKCQTPPVILTQPVSLRVNPGSNVLFSVFAGGNPRLRYQWTKDGAPLAGNSETALTLTNVQSAQAGIYTVLVTNWFGQALSSNAVLTVNRVPAALSVARMLNEDAPLAIALLGDDPDADPLTYSIVTAPVHGTLSGVPPHMLYVPATNYHGDDSFAFTVNDGLVDSAPATVSLTILPVNDPPVAQGLGVVIVEDAVLYLALGAFDVDGDPLTFTVGAPAHGTLTGTPPNLTYRPNTNYVGWDGFTFSVSDGQTNSGLATVIIAMRPVNDSPVAVSQSVSLNEDTNLGINLVAFDVDGDPLTYTVGAPTNGTLTGTAPNLTYTPNTNYHGPDSFTFSVSDGALNSEIATVNLTVLPVNDPPVADASATVTLVISPNNSNANVVLDGSRSSDVDGDSLQYLWFANRATNAVGTGIVAVVVLPVGTNWVTLQVNDGLATGTNLVTVNVLTVAQALQRLKGLAQSTPQPRPLLGTLDPALFVAQRGQPKLAIPLLRVFQLQVRAQVLPADPTLAETLIREARSIIIALSQATTRPLLAAHPPATLPAQGTVANPAHPSLRLQFNGESGRAYVVESSANLADWEKIGVATEIGEGDFGFDATIATHWPRGFYRIVVP